MEHFHNPRNQGKITEKQEGEEIVTGQVGSIACGDALKLHLKIDQNNQMIKEAKFQTFGCASAIASSSALTELLKGKKVEEALKLTNKEIAESLGGLPKEKMHCSVMGQEALEAAIYKYKGIPINNHSEDEGNIICRCFGVTENKIRRIAIENNLKTTEQITNYIKAGGGCSSCLPNIDDLLNEIYSEKETTIEVNSLSKNQKDIIFDKYESDLNQDIYNLTNIQKISFIQKVIDEEIRPILVEDGGDLELFDVEGNIVKVILKGACNTCTSSTETLKIAIEATLRDRILPNLIVEAV